MQKKKRGRPALKEPKEVMISLRLSEKELQELKWKAYINGMSVSKLIRKYCGFNK